MYIFCKVKRNDDYVMTWRGMEYVVLKMWSSDIQGQEIMGLMKTHFDEQMKKPQIIIIASLSLQFTEL